MILGCHLSSSGGYTAMAKQAAAINANTFQFFTRNPRGGSAKDIDESVKRLSFTISEGINMALA